MENLDSLQESITQEINTAIDIPTLKGIKRKYLGKQGEIEKIIKLIPTYPQERRKEIGRKINAIKSITIKLIEEKEIELKKKMKELQHEEISDITLPPLPIEYAHPHPINQVMSEILDIFKGLAFQVVYGPEIETDYNNFEALNIPKYHPARDLQDTFYITEELLLRTHTSPVQIRIMKKYPPPLRIVSPGKVYRRDNIDATHSIVFHQIEGLAVDSGITFADLKGTLEYFLRSLFSKNIKTRFRPSYFPFTEPSAEMDIECLICKGIGCATCKKSGWLEILGCGMVNKKVFEYVGYPEGSRGFAFGLGVERIAMLKYKINDMRLFYQNDLRFIKQF